MLLRLTPGNSNDGDEQKWEIFCGKIKQQLPEIKETDKEFTINCLSIEHWWRLKAVITNLLET